MEFITILLALSIIILILIQGRGAGLGSAWGGGGEFYQTRRGLERFAMQLTAVLIFIFFIVSVINLAL